MKLYQKSIPLSVLKLIKTKFPKLKFFSPDRELICNVHDDTDDSIFLNFRYKIIRFGCEAIVIGSQEDNEFVLSSERSSKNYYQNEKVAILAAIIKSAQMSKNKLLLRQLE